MQRKIVTVRSIQDGIENELVRQPLSPSTIYVNGFTYIRALSQLAALSRGKYAVERNVVGIFSSLKQLMQSGSISRDSSE